MKKFKLFFRIALAVIVIGSSACFDIVEEYHFNTDGSGTAKFTVDLKDMMAMMESFSSAMDSTGESTESIDEMFESTATTDRLKKLPGIRNVRNLADREAGVVGYSFEFANLESLNNALVATDGEFNITSAMGMGGEGISPDSENNFERKGRKLIRTVTLPPPDETEEPVDEDEESYQEMAKMFFADHYYRISYSFDQKVAKVKKNDKAVIGADGRSVDIKFPLTDLLEREAELGSVIKLKKAK